MLVVQPAHIGSGCAAGCGLRIGDLGTRHYSDDLTPYVG
jgi:hypothetical protein